MRSTKQSTTATTGPLRALRRRQNLTLDELGRSIDLSAGQLSRIERDGCMVRDTADRIAKHFGYRITIEQVMFPQRRRRA